MDEEAIASLSKIFKAVADPTRQKIVLLLRNKGEQAVNSIAEQLGVAQPAASQHLRVLREAEVLLARKSGQKVYYRLYSDRVCDALEEFVQIYLQEVAKVNNQTGV